MDRLPILQANDKDQGANEGGKRGALRVGLTLIHHPPLSPELTPRSLMMCLVCLVCCPLLLCLPLMMSKTQSWTHTCSDCSAVVAIRGQQGDIEVKEPPPSKLVPSKFGAANQGVTA